MDDERKPGADVWRYSSRRQAIAPAGALFAIWLVHAWPYGLPLVSVGADWRVIVPLALLLLAALVLLPSATADRPMRRKKSKRPSRGNACPSGAPHVSPRWKHMWLLSRDFQADARTRTGDPFITSYGQLSARVTASHLRRNVERNPLDSRGDSR
jgi:hypothetical protein